MRYDLRRCTDDDRGWAYALKSVADRDVVERQFGPWDEVFQRGLFAQRRNPGISRVIVVDGIPAGLVAFEARGDGRSLDEIQLLAVWRDRGLGSMIITDLLRRGSLRLQVLKENVRARALYQRLGFQVEAETTTHFGLRHPGSGNNLVES